MAAEAGFDMQIHVTEFARSLDLAGKGAFGAYYVAWSGRTDPDGNLTNMLACKGPTNYAHYCNPVVEKAIVAATQVDDPAARLAQYKIAAAQIETDLPILYIFHRRWMYAYTTSSKASTPIPTASSGRRGCTQLMQVSKNLLFLKKKKQKDFYPWLRPRRHRTAVKLGMAGAWREDASWLAVRSRAPAQEQRDKSFLVLFFKKEPLSS